MSTDTYQKSQRQRKEYNKHMKQIDESKSLLKSLVKVRNCLEIIRNFLAADIATG